MTRKDKSVDSLIELCKTSRTYKIWVDKLPPELQEFCTVFRQRVSEQGISHYTAGERLREYLDQQLGGSISLPTPTTISKWLRHAPK